MINKGFQKLILFLSIMIILIGIVNAADIENTTDNIVSNIEEHTLDTSLNEVTSINQEDTIDNIEEIENSITNDKTTINKKDKNSTHLKEASDDTKITYNTINPVTLGNSVKISGNLLNDGKGIKGENITINIDNLQYTVKTGKNGTFSTIFIPTDNQKYYVSFNYLGTDNYKASRNSTSFFVTKATNIELNNMDPVSYHNIITISGHLLAGGKGVNNARVEITIGEKGYVRYTSSSGYFEVDYYVNTYDKQKIIAKFNGNNYFKESKSTFTLNTKKTSNIRIFQSKTTKYDENVKICGKLLSNSSVLKYQPINITVDEMTYTTTTTKTGYFAINHITNKVGVNDGKIKYGGNIYYEPSSNTTKFTVTKQDTHVIFNPVSNIKYGKNVTVTGKLLDRNNKAISNTWLKIGLNGKMEIVHTNENGIFKYSHKTSRLGTNIISAIFSERNNYMGTDNKTTFKVVNKSTILKCYVSNAIFKDYTNITGYLVDKDYNNLKNVRLFVTLNGKRYSTVTDSEGDFIFPFYARKTGINRVTVTFKGTQYYTKSSVTKYFKVDKKGTYIYVDSIIAGTYGDTIKITGELYDDDYNNMKYKPLVLKINKKSYTIKTNKYGAYSYNYKINKIGTNTVLVSFVGDRNYTKCSDYNSFDVEKAYTITISTPKNREAIQYVGTDYFSAGYQTYYGQRDPGVFLDLYYTHATDMGQIGTYMLLDATFYFRNSKGRIITKKYVEADATVMWHPLISGYTPYKIVAKYRKITALEKKKWDYGYSWDPLTKEWIYND